MIESVKKLKEFSGKLNNKNPKIVSEVINHLRDNTPFKGAIGLLAELFERTDIVEIKDDISNFFNDMKESGARKEVISEIQKTHTNETIGMLVASCWQSGLDYSEFAQDIAIAFVKGDYLIALECLTVLEESLHKLGLEKRTVIINILEQDVLKTIPDKVSLRKELISIMKKDIPPSS
jgi:histidyl-tRNA synthetase